MNITVSVVEDNPAVRDSLRDLINCSPGYICASSHGDAEDALSGIPRISPDVVLMDIHLPGINGVECARRLKPQLPATEIIMLTVFQDTEHIFNALAAGATGYLLKLTPHEQLLAAIKEVHGGGSVISGHVARKIVQSFQQPAPALAKLEGLSPRETEILDLVAKGFRDKEIAASLNIAYDTVHCHIRKVYKKLQVRSRAEAALKYYEKTGLSRSLFRAFG